MTEFPRETLTEFGKQFSKARSMSDIEREQEIEGTLLSDEEEELIESVEEETMLSLIGVGGNRISFSLPGSDNVVLFPRWGPEGDSFHNGRVSNTNEVTIWTNLEDAGKEDEYNFLPVLESHADGFWVIKPEITPVREDTESVREEWDESGKDQLWENVFAFNEYINMMDVTEANACKRDGEFVLFDYGSEPKDDF